jgi:hypothetical protein
MAIKTKSNDILASNTVFAWIAVIAIAVLLLPLIAMQFSNSVNWTSSDFAVAGGLIFITGSIFVLLARLFPKYSLIIGILVALVFLYAWAELAVGIFFHLGS